MLDRNGQSLSKEAALAARQREAVVIIRRLRDLGLDKRGNTSLLIKWLQRNPSQTVIREELSNRIETEEQILLAKPDPYRAVALWTPDALDGPYGVGTVLQTGFPYGTNDRLLSEQTLIVGRGGGGKTTVAKTLLLNTKRASPHITMAIIERKREYTDLAKELGFHIITTETLRINPLRPPPGVSDRVWKSVFAQSLMDDQEILVPTSNLIMDAIDELLEPRRADGRYPTLAELNAHIESKHYPPSSRLAGYQAAAMNRIGGLCNALPDTFADDGGYDVSRMNHTDHLILLHDIPHLVHQNYLIKLLLDQIFVYRMVVDGLQRRVDTIVLLDEATSLFRRTDETQRNPSYLSYIISQARAYGLAIIATSQYAGDLSHALLGNTSTKILVGGMEKNDDRRTFLDLRPHTPEQADVVKSFREPGHAFISDPRHTHFIECIIHQPDLPPPMEPAEVAARAQESARALGWVRSRNEDAAAESGATESPAEQSQTESPAGEPPLRSPPSEPDRDMMVLADVEQTPFQTFKVRTERLGLPREPMQDAIKRLEANHLIVIHKVHLRAGAPSDLYEVTETGYRALGKEAPARRGHGSYLHQFYQRSVAAHWRSKGYDVTIEGRAEEKAVDIIAVQRPEGETVAVEIELHVKTSMHFVHNLLKDIGAPRVTRVVCVVPTQEEIKVVQKGIKENAELAANRERITVDYVRNYMEIPKCE